MKQNEIFSMIDQVQNVNLMRLNNFDVDAYKQKWSHIIHYEAMKFEEKVELIN